MKDVLARSGIGVGHDSYVLDVVMGFIRFMVFVQPDEVFRSNNYDTIDTAIYVFGRFFFCASDVSFEVFHESHVNVVVSWGEKR